MIDLEKLFGEEFTVAKTKTAKTPRVSCVSNPNPVQTENVTRTSGSRQKTYSEKLRDPRWQKKRLEVMERDGFACVNCCTKVKTLNVHHWYYRKSAEPWDYPDMSLACLCDECHTQIEGLKTQLLFAIGKYSIYTRANNENAIDLICWLIGYAKGLSLNEDCDAEEFASYTELLGAFSAWGIEERWLDHVLGRRLDQWDFSGEDADGLPVLVTNIGVSNAISFADMLQSQEEEIERVADGYWTRRSADGYVFAGWWI